MKRATLLGVLMVVVLSFCSCKNDMQKVKFFDRQSLPQQIVKDAVVIHSDGGHLQMRLAAPYIYKYSKPEEKTVYPKGVSVTFFKDGRANTSLKARYAISLDERKIMMARDSVVIISYASGDTTYLQDIVWNQSEGRIYSNRPVRSVNGKRVTLGDGFQSDDQFIDPQIYHQRGVVEWADK